MNNRHIVNVLLVIGWIIIMMTAISFIISIIMSPFASITGTQLLFYILDSMPYLFIGVTIVWLGKRINKNRVLTDQKDGSRRNNSIGKSTKIFGWVVVLLASLYTIFGYTAISFDASGSAYAPLILSVGIIFISIGLIIVWFGLRIQKNSESN